VERRDVNEGFAALDNSVNLPSIVGVRIVPKAGETFAGTAQAGPEAQGRGEEQLTAKL